MARLTRELLIGGAAIALIIAASICGAAALLQTM